MPYLVITSGPNAGVSYHLTDATLIGGREANRDMQIVDPKVSRRHFVVQKSNDDYEIEEADATNGVFVNGKRTKRAKLKDGDQIKVGDTEITFYAAKTQSDLDAVRRGRVLSPQTTAKTVVGPKRPRPQ